MTQGLEEKIDVRGIPKTELLVALANGAKKPEKYSAVTIEMAEEALKSAACNKKLPHTAPYILGLAGRWIHIEFTDLLLDVSKYNEINGAKCAQKIIHEKWPDKVRVAEPKTKILKGTNTGIAPEDIRRQQETGSARSKT